MMKKAEKSLKEKPGNMLKTEALLNMLEDLQEARKGLEEGQEELTAVNKFNKEIIEKAPFGIYAINERGIVEYANPAMCKISGMAKEKFEGINILTLPTYKKIGISEKIKNGLKGKPFFVGPVDYTSYYGKKKTVRNFTGIPMKVGGVNKLLMIIEDVTKQKEAVEELRKSEQFTKDIIEHAGIPIIAYRRADGLLIVNKKFLGVTGYKREDIDDIHKLYRLAFPSKLVRAKINQSLSKVYKGIDVDNCVIPIMCKDGSTTIVVCNMTAMKDEGGKIMGEVMSMRDLSEIFKLEEQIRYWAANGFIQVRKDENGNEIVSKIEISQSKIKKNKKQKTA